MRFRQLTFLTAVNRFRTSADSWLSDEDFPALVALDVMARQLDERVTPALIAQFGLVYRNLLSRKPTGSDEEDELSKALREAGEQS